MAKKNAKKAVRKGSKSPKKGSQSAKKAVARKTARTGGSHVSFGLHGMTNIMKKVHEAGLEPELNEQLGHDDKFVKVQRKSLAKIKKFVASKPQLKGLAGEMQSCDCPPDDPYCIYI